MNNRLLRIASAGVAGGYAVSVVVLAYLNASELRAAATSLSLPSAPARHALGEISLASSAALFAVALLGLRAERTRGARRSRRHG